MRAIRLLLIVYWQWVTRVLEWTRFIPTEAQMIKYSFPLLAPKEWRVAQPVERRPVKPVVAGSSPAAPAMLHPGMSQRAAFEAIRQMQQQQMAQAQQLQMLNALNQQAAGNIQYGNPYSMGTSHAHYCDISGGHATTLTGYVTLGGPPRRRRRRDITQDSV
jgi:hypothetical protein